MSAAHRDHHSGESSAYQEAADNHDDDSDDDDHDEARLRRALMTDLCTNLEGLSYFTLCD